jgi:hypothetical protein
MRRIPPQRGAVRGVFGDTNGTFQQPMLVMKSLITLPHALILLGAVLGHAQERAIASDLAKVADRNAWTVFNAGAEFVALDGRRAVNLDSISGSSPAGALC